MDPVEDFDAFCDHVGLDALVVRDLATRIVGIAGRKGLIGNSGADIDAAYMHAIRTILISQLPTEELAKIISG